MWHHSAALAIMAAVSLVGSSAAGPAADIAGVLDPARYARHQVVSAGQYVMHWTCDATDLAVMVETFGATSLGFGIAEGPSGRMTGSDIAIGYLSGSALTVDDRKATSQSAPVPDAVDNLVNPSIEQDDSGTRMAFGRAKDTGDATGDNVIRDGMTRIVWALGSSNAVSYHRANKGILDLELCVAPPSSALEVAASLSPGHYQNNIALVPSQVELHWTCDSTHLAVLLTTTGQSSLGFGIATGPSGGMVGADIAIGFFDSNGIPRVEDRKAVTKTPPALDATDNLDARMLVQDGSGTQLAFVRRKDTGDATGDNVIRDGMTRIVWALGSSNAVSYHRANKGILDLELCVAPPTVPPTIPTPAPGLAYAPSLDSSRYDNHLVLSVGEYVMHWTCDRFHLVVLVESFKPSYVGFGIAKSLTTFMTGADMAIGYVNAGGVATVEDRHAVGKRTPLLDTVDNLDARALSQDSSGTRMSFVRLKDTGDAEDLVIADGITRVLWATGSSNTIRYHESRGHADIKLCQPTIEPEIAGPPISTLATTTTTAATTATTTTATTTAAVTAATPTQGPPRTIPPLFLRDDGSRALLAPRPINTGLAMTITTAAVRGGVFNSVGEVKCGLPCLCTRSSVSRFRSTVPTINFPARRVPTDPFMGAAGVVENFGIAFEGEIFLRQSGQYRFFLNGSDEYDLLIDDRRVFRVFGAQVPRESSKTITLTSGWKSFRLEYQYGVLEPLTPGAHLVLEWQGPGFHRQIIPRWAFQHRAEMVTKLSPGGRDDDLVNIIDGSPATCYTTGFADPDHLGAAVRIDLGMDYDVSELLIMLGPQSEGRAGISVLIASEAGAVNFDGVNSLATECFSAASPIPGARIACTGRARHIIILQRNDVARFPAPRRMEICEVRVWAAEVAPAQQSPQEVWPWGTADIEAPASLVAPRPLDRSLDQHHFELFPTPVEQSSLNSPWSRDQAFQMPHMALYPDFSTWQPRTGTKAYFTLDLGEEMPISAFRMRQPPATGFQRGVKDFYISMGSRLGSLVNVARGKPGRASVGGAAMAAKFTDGVVSDVGCPELERLPGKDYPWVYIDLGSSQRIEEIAIHMAPRFSNRVEFRVANEIDALFDDDSTDCGTHIDLNWRTDADFDTRRSVYCPKRGRYVMVRGQGTATIGGVCEIEVGVRSGANLRGAARGTMDPGFGYEWQDERAYTNVVLRRPLVARYIRFEASSFYKAGAGLSWFQVYSNEEPPTYTFQSRAHTVATPVPGLVTELMHTFPGPATGYRKQLELFESVEDEMPFNTTVVPDFNFGDSEFVIRHRGSAATPLRSTSLRVNFKAGSHTLAPSEATVAIHPSLADCCAAAFTFRAANLSVSGFDIEIDVASGSAWDSTELAAAGRLVLVWTTKTQFPTKGTFDTVTRRHPFIMRSFGQLLVPASGQYTFDLVASDVGILRIDGVELARADGPSGCCDGTVHSRTATVWLSKGPHDIEVRLLHVRDERILRLYWTTPTLRRSIIAPEYFEHTRGPMCLESLEPTKGWGMAECNPLSPAQQFRRDGGWLRSAHLPNLCLSNPNRLTGPDGAVVPHVCFTGGRQRFRNAEGDREEHFYAGQLWDTSDGLHVRSLNTRPLADPGCDYTSRSIDGLRSSYRCEARGTPAPPVCLRHDTVRDWVTTAPCVKADPLNEWVVAQAAVGGEPLRKLALGGAFTLIDHYAFNPRFENRLAWPRVLTKDEVCVKFAGNNTCSLACDGICHDPTLGGIEGCSPESDSYDCESNDRLNACARLCYDDPECMVFSHRHDNPNDCYTSKGYGSGNAHSNRPFAYDLRWATYHKVAGAPRPASFDAPTVYCPLATHERGCPAGPCAWKPRPGQPIDAPVCSDTNPYPAQGADFSCTSYWELGMCASATSAMLQCAVTCAQEQYCQAIEFSCQYADPPTPPPPTACPSGLGTLSLTGASGIKCRCARDYACAGSECKTASTGGGRGVLAPYFDVDCPDCSCNWAGVGPPPSATLPNLNPGPPSRATTVAGGGASGSPSSDAPRGKVSDPRFTILVAALVMGVALLSVVAAVKQTRARRDEQRRRGVTMEQVIRAIGEGEETVSVVCPPPNVSRPQAAEVAAQGPFANPAYNIGPAFPPPRELRGVAVARPGLALEAVPPPLASSLADEPCRVEPGSASLQPRSSELSLDWDVSPSWTAETAFDLDC